jgi:hypothetical protein
LRDLQSTVALTSSTSICCLNQEESKAKIGAVKQEATQMKKLICVALILCLALSDIAMAAGGGGSGGVGAGVGGAGGVSGGGWYGGYVGDTGGRRRTYRAYYPYAYYPYAYYPYYAYRPDYPYLHHTWHLTHDNHGRRASLKKKTVAYATASRQAKAEHYRSHQAQRAEQMTPQRHSGASAETAINQIPSETHALSLGTPLLGLDPRSPSTWALYSQMLPFIFSEAPATASHEIGTPRHHDDETGM